MSKGWDNATLKKLKALTGKGLSTAEIGKRLGMSKNAVVGKLNRMGWNLKAAEKQESTPATKSKSAPAPKKPAAKAATGAAKKPAATKTTTAKATTTKKTASLKEKAVPKKATAKAAAPKKAPATPAAEKPVDKKSLNKTLAMHQRIIQHSLELAGLKPNQCRWPIGDPDSENFHFCGEQVFVGKPYCFEHCRQAYQFTPPKKK